MRRYLTDVIIVLTACAWVCGAAAQAPADPSAAFAAGSEAFARGDFAGASASFEAARAEGMEGPAVLYNLGVSRYRSGDFAQAETVFRSLAENFPAMREIAYYNLGLTLHRLNREADARAAFELARFSDDPTVASLAEAMLVRTAPTDPTPSEAELAVAARWVKLLDFAIGYDDNVALLEESSLPAGFSTDSSFAEVFGLITGRFTGFSSLRFDASGYSVRYADASEFDQDALRVGLAYLWNWSSWQLDAGPYFNYSALSGDGFERRLGAALNARYPVGDSAMLLIRFLHDEVNDLEPAFEFVAGSRDRVSIGFEQQRDRGRLTLGYVHEQNDRVGANVSPTRHEVFAGYEYAMTGEWSVEVQGSMRTSRYEELSTPRDEDLSQLSLTATRDFETGWQLLGQYRIADNASNVELFSYDRNRFVVGLNKLF